MIMYRTIGTNNLKELTNTWHTYIYLIENPHEMQDFMRGRRTYVIPKAITSLPALYKILTSIVADKIYKHLEITSLLDEEQKECRKSSKGCKEQLLIYSTVVLIAVRGKRWLYAAYILTTKNHMTVYLIRGWPKYWNCTRSKNI